MILKIANKQCTESPKPCDWAEGSLCTPLVHAALTEYTIGSCASKALPLYRVIHQVMGKVFPQVRSDLLWWITFCVCIKDYDKKFTFGWSNRIWHSIFTPSNYFPVWNPDTLVYSIIRPLTIWQLASVRLWSWLGRRPLLLCWPSCPWDPAWSWGSWARRRLH